MIREPSSRFESASQKWKKVPSIYSAQEWNLQHIFLLLMVQLIFLLFWWDSSQYISSMIQMEKFLSSNDNLILNDKKEII